MLIKLTLAAETYSKVLGLDKPSGLSKPLYIYLSLLNCIFSWVQPLTATSVREGHITTVYLTE